MKTPTMSNIEFESFLNALKRATDNKRNCLENYDYYHGLSEIAIAVRGYRRDYDSFVEMWEDLDSDVDYVYLTIEVYRYNDLLDKYYAWRMLYETQDQRNMNHFRAHLNIHELRELEYLEAMIVKVGTKHNLSLQDAISWIHYSI
jgi:hypothetical protein